MDDLWELLLQACHGTPDWYGVSRRHWVMDLGWYKQIRRYATQYRPDPEPDEDKWVPGPDDTLFGYPVTVCEDGCEPYLAGDGQGWGSEVRA
jgi:hypothetical protein